MRHTMDTLTDDTIAQMLRVVDPDWSLRSATPAERGFCRVFRVTVEQTGERDDRTLYLKATPGENDGGIPADARLLTLLGRRTGIPVPTVLGVVDESAEVPAPFYVMTAMPGTELPYERVGHLPEETLRTLAAQVGASLGELHGIEGLDGFGHITHDPDRALAGGRPAGTVADLTVDGSDTWAGFLRAWVDRELDRHADSRFDRLTPALREWCDDRVATVPEPTRPVPGRNDHGLHNLLVDEATGDLRAMLDWAYTLAVTPAFDVEYAVYLFSGAFLAGLPDVCDRRELVRAAMLAGYRSRAPDRADALAEPTPLYELLAAVRVMNDFDQLRLPDGSDQQVASALADDVEAIIDDGG
jgi:aminoglycoside phosphotransferase (APT) family kinase protein